MIFDNIDNIENYKGLSNTLDRAIQMIESKAFDCDVLGKHTVDGACLFYLVQEYDTKERYEVGMEAHRRYIDLQLMIEGEECMDVANTRELTELLGYDEASDYMMYDGLYQRILVKENDFAIFFPNDGHRAGIANISSRKVKKVVFKIACDNPPSIL